MNRNESTERTDSELFGTLIPYLMVLFVSVLITLSGKTALYAGTLFGAGIVLLAGVLKHRENRQRNVG
jgi:uncharacterized membrane protein YgdD (TMEM256/DUF423 family)